MALNIAVVGGGIAGLSAADRLARRHRVTLFEASHTVGGHAHTVDVELDGERHAIDTGFMVFNDRTYPNFVKLLAELGVSSRPTTMGFSVQCAEQHPTHDVTRGNHARHSSHEHSSGLEFNGSSLNGLFADRRNLFRPSFYRLLRDILRFYREAPNLMQARDARGLHTGPPHTELTVRQFLEQRRYSRQFGEQFLLPLGSAIWSCPLGTFADFPMRFIAEFFWNHGLLQFRDRPTWRVIEGGARRYVQSLLARFPGHIRVATPIRQVRRFADRVEVTPVRGEPQAFDHVVLACHSDQALRMLDDPSPVERELLGKFRYQQSIAVLHTDTSLLPSRRRAWACWNYHLPSDPASGATVTYCLSLLQHIRSRHVFNLSLNRQDEIDPSKVLGTFVYEHPIFTVERAAAQARHHELIDANRTSYCGAYWRNGFHEDGVVSALAVCRTLEANYSDASARVITPESMTATS